MNIIEVDNSCEIHSIDDLKKYYEQIKTSIKARMLEFKQID